MGLYNCPDTLYGIRSGMSLDRYQELMRLPPAAFNGLNKHDEQPVYACSTIWKHSERLALSMVLAQAEQMREAELNYHLVPTYDISTVAYIDPLIMDWKYVTRLGLEVVDILYTDVALSLGSDIAPTDPVMISVTVPVGTAPDEVKICYPGLECTINPSKVVISEVLGVYTANVSIPRSRLVKPELMDDRDDPLDYYSNENFLETVDVRRVWYDEARAMDYVMPAQDNSLNNSTYQSAYAVVLNSRTAEIEHMPATRISGIWRRTPLCTQPTAIQIRYISGITPTINSELATIRLANTLMVNKPCSCPTVEMMWQEDHQNTDTWTPYGSYRGAIMAWMLDSRAKVGLGGKFPGMSR